MKPSFLFLTSLLFIQTCFAQSTLYNLSFEHVNENATLPIGWDLSFQQGGAAGYLAQLDPTTVQEGKYAVTIFPDPTKEKQEFGACSYMIPAKYAGKTIELRGYLKTKDIAQEGFAGLWLRIDGENGMLAFDNMESRAIRGTNDWKEYSIQLPLNEEAARIVFGGLIAGKGQIWIDNLQLLIDGKPIEQAPAKIANVFPAQLDSIEFKEGSKITLASITPQQIKDLDCLGKVWGFIKYYHPQVAQGNVNMDAELFRILPEILASKNEKERDQYLLSWIEKLGAVPECNTCKTDFDVSKKLTPDLAWMNDKTIDQKLKDKLRFILKNRNQEKHYYIALAPNVGNPVFNHEEAYPQFQFPDTGYRLLALYRYWNIIHYFFPYKYAIEEDWNKVLTTFIPEFVQAKDALAYRLALLKLIGSIHDTHANLWVNDSILNNYKGKLYAPAQITFVENKAVVTDYYNAELGKTSGLKIGDIVIAIDGKMVDAIVKERAVIYPASNYPTKLRNIARDLLRGSTENVQLTIQRDDKKLDLPVQRYESSRLNLAVDRAYKQPDTCFRMLNESIGYINLGNIKTDLLPTIFKTFSNTKGIVIDIRNYPSEFVVFSLGQYLYPAPKAFVKFTSGDIHYPGLFHWTDPIEVGTKNPDYYKGKVVILINEITQSQAEYTTMAFRNAPNVTVIGSTTAGADGNVSPFYLPGNMRTMISGIGVYYPDGKETQRIGILPDIEVKPTIKGIKAGKDELLEKAMEVINARK